MFLPLHDRNPLVVIPFQRVTVSIILINVVIFLMHWSAGPEAFNASMWHWGIKTGVLVNGLPEGAPVDAGVFTFVSHMFTHGGWMHLAGNMLCLWVYGDNIEDSSGHLKFLLFYLLCGLGSTVADFIVDPHSTIPTVGASGAISGVMGAYLMLHPRVKVWVLAFGRIPIKLPALIPLAIWFGLQFLSLDQPGVAWWAHIGGFVTGALLITVMKRPELPLFDMTKEGVDGNK
jgi:membrane associated rhomboid family serine protease